MNKVILIEPGAIKKIVIHLGLAGFSLMTVFFVLTAFFPASYVTAMAVAAPGALIMMTYQILLARKFFQLGRSRKGSNHE